MPLFLQSRLLAAHGVPHGFSLRTGGVSPAPFDSLNLGGAVGDDPAAVRENHHRLLAATGITPTQFTGARQVHGRRVVHAAFGEGILELRDSRTGESLKDPEADALIASPGTAVGVRTADCVPLLFHDPITGVSAAVHAGWRGTVADIVGETIRSLASEYGVRPASVRAAIGPCIGPCCFEVGEEVAEAFVDASLAASVRAAEPRPHVDLRAANRALAEQAGLAPHHVEILNRCTSCEPDAFFSHRRDAGRTGRHLAVIAAGRF